LSVLFENLASSCNTEMLHHSHTIVYDDQCPISRTSKFTSVYRICDPREGNVHMVI